MKKLFILVAIAIMCVFNCNAQSFTREGKTFSAVSTKSKSEGKLTGYTWKDSKGIEYPIYIRENGHCYIIKVSKKNGKEYKQSLSEEVSKEICKLVNVLYVKPNKTK